MSIKTQLAQIYSSLPSAVSLVAVSKTKPVEMVLEAYRAGQRRFGENKIQEMQFKFEALPKDIEWHFIGHVQRNKVRFLAPFVSLIHGVDSLKLLAEIDAEAAKNNRKIDCLFQIFIASEDSKFGLNPTELQDILVSDIFKELQNVRIVGLMGMASFTENVGQIKAEFEGLKSVFDELKNHKTDNFELQILSMGMSGDYQIAVDCGSTMVRIGSAIFGGR